ncbi:MAG: hypothetical protein CM15mP125_3570 [Gammaproteobacteria bacterium]|nr:MAG: hypothetical protein CM15mP125_3570 [Gammaproteobacteria bacterium]
MQAFYGSPCSRSEQQRGTISGGEPIQPGAEPEAALSGGVDPSRRSVGAGFGALFWLHWPPDSPRVFSRSLVAFIAAAPLWENPFPYQRASIIQRGLLRRGSVRPNDADPDPDQGRALERPGAFCAGQVASDPGRGMGALSFEIPAGKWWRLSGAPVPASPMHLFVFMRQGASPNDQPMHFLKPDYRGSWLVPRVVLFSDTVRAKCLWQGKPTDGAP